MPILEVGADELGRIYVVPAEKTYEFIWRDASGIRWDEKTSALYAPAPGEITQAVWFRGILLAVQGEYGDLLEITGTTRWTNVSETLRSEISNSSR